MLQLTAGNKITEVCTPNGHSGSLQKVPLRHPVDWMNCGFGQPSDFADFFGTCLQSLKETEKALKPKHLDAARVI